MSSAISWAGRLEKPGPASDSSFDPKLRMATRFEPNMSLDAMTSVHGNQANKFRGTDAITGFNFDTANYYGTSYNNGWKMTSLVTDGSSTTDPGSAYVYHDVRQVFDGPAGNPTNVLRMGFHKSAEPFTYVQQGFMETSDLGGLTGSHSSYPGPYLTDYYCRYWMRVNSDIQTQGDDPAQSGGAAAYWRMCWEYKSERNHRIHIGMYNHHPPGLHWFAQIDGGGWSPIYGTPILWQGNDDVKIPTPGTWYYIEVQFHRADDASGFFKFAVNGTLIYSHTGDMRGANESVEQDAVAIMGHVNLYSHWHLGEVWQEIDGLEVYDFPPGNVFPSGPPPF